MRFFSPENELPSCFFFLCTCTRYPVLRIKVTLVTKINFYTIYRKLNFEISIYFKEACHTIYGINF